MFDLLHEAKGTIIRGIIGIAGPIGGWTVSVQNVEAWMRVTSLAVGIVVGLLSIISIIRKWRQ